MLSHALTRRKQLMRDLTLADMFDSVFDLETDAMEEHALKAFESKMDQIEEGNTFEDDYDDMENS